MGDKVVLSCWKLRWISRQPAVCAGFVFDHILAFFSAFLYLLFFIFHRLPISRITVSIII